MSQLNPKYFWIWLTSLENTLMLIFKHEVKILAFYSILEQMGSHILLFMTFDVEIISFYKKIIKKEKKRFAPRGN